jgi:Na+/proline symporter
MRLTPQEVKMVERLRRDERAWQRWRWTILAIVPLAFGFGAYFAYFVCRLLDSKVVSEAQTAMLIAVLWPQVLLVLVVAAGLMGLAVRDWHGKAHRALLLKLIEAHERESTNDEKGG